MSNLKEFKEKVLSTENPFLLNDGNAKILCVKVPIGQATYVYTMQEWLDGKEIVTDISDKLEITAIVKENTIYIIHPYLIMDKVTEEYPDNMYRVGDEFLEKIKLRIKKEVIDKMYEELDISALSESKEDECKKIARWALVYKKDIHEYVEMRVKANIGELSIQKFADSLCGVINLEELARDEFKAHQEMWKKIKAETKRIKELVLKTPETVLEGYEQKIVDGLHSVDAKTVQVEFLYNGKTATGKVNRDTILRMLSQNDYFSSFNFTTMKSGEKIISELGAGTWRTDNPLTCKHIVKITYGKKALYQNQKNGTL